MKTPSPTGTPSAGGFASSPSILMGPLIPIPENGFDRAKRVPFDTDILFDANSLSLFDDLV